ncbi:MAG TPA: FTR1 family protein [Symbiobacteriaceae bacterium]|jgi:high-affinity iron transporter|nr:FTR1 family protein [Symbiobacteriaceae bacterium]
MKRWSLSLVAVLTLVLTLAAPAWASPSSDMTAANELVATALKQAQGGDLEGAKDTYEQFRTTWLDIEDGVKEVSKTAYRLIEEEMANVQFAYLQTPVDAAKVTGALTALQAANQKFSDGGYPADGATAGSREAPAESKRSVADLLALLDQAVARGEAGDSAGAAAAMDQFRQSWLEVEGVVLTQSAQIYGDAERDMVDAYAYFKATPPNLVKGVATAKAMKAYLAPIAGKTAYSIFDAASIILREGLEALLVVVALLGFLKKGGHADKSRWIWGGVAAGLALSAVLAVAIKVLFGTGAFGNNNFLIQGGTGIFAAVMLVYVSYWLHSKSSVAEWNRYIKEKSTAALATGNLLGLATLAFLAIFREGTETVLFYIGMASSIQMQDLLLGLGLGFVVLLVLAVAMLKVGLKIPLRPFFLVSSVLVFYLGFKFTGMGIHGLQLAGLLPATVVPYLPHLDFLALYPNWQSTLPQLLLLLFAAAMVLYTRRRGGKGLPENPAA